MKDLGREEILILLYEAGCFVVGIFLGLAIGMIYL